VHRSVVEVFAPRGVPFIPEHLNDDAQQCMRFIIANFGSKHLGGLDTYALSIFAGAWAWLKHADQVMSEPGFMPVIVSVDKNDQERHVPNPWFKIRNEQARVMLMAGAKLYLTPADRHLLDNAGQERPVSKFEGLIGRTKSSDLSNDSSSPQESDKDKNSDS
jgi:phage terminase small subunit